VRIFAIVFRYTVARLSAARAERVLPETMRLRGERAPSERGALCVSFAELH
jgi:hypothetical protein